MTWTWRSAVACAVLANLVAWLYRPVLVNLVRQWWDDPNYSHGFLIPPMIAYLVWERRERLAGLTAAPALLGLAVLIGGVGLFALGNVAAELFTMRISLLVILVGLVLYLLGREHLKVLAFPILFLLFMIPPPTIVFNAIAFPLQLFAARTATASLDLLGVPVLREGNLITLANTTLEVAEACSGIRSLITLLALAATYAYFTQRGFWRRGVLFISAVPIAIVANAGRVAGTGVLAQFLGERVAQGFFHTFSGWLLFAVAFILLFAEGFLLNRVARRPRRLQGALGKVTVAPREPLAMAGKDSGGI